MAKKYRFDPFGEIDPTVDEYWEATIELDGEEVECDLNIEADTLDPERVYHLTGLLLDLQRLVRAARTAMIDQCEADGRDDWSNQSAAWHYRDHFSAFSEDELLDCFGASDRWREDIRAFVPHLDPCRVGLYPEDESLVLDFAARTKGEPVSNYLVSVVFSSTGAITTVSLES